MFKEPPNSDSGKPESENDCASLGEVVVYQPERTAANLFLGYQRRIPNGEGNLNAGVLAKSVSYAFFPAGRLASCLIASTRKSWHRLE
jgi:hypothetical protein